MRLYRRVIEIRDGRLALRDSLPQSVAESSRARAQVIGLNCWESEAFVEAKVLEAALEAIAIGDPVAAQPWKGIGPRAESTAVEVEWLRTVAANFAAPRSIQARNEDVSSGRGKGAPVEQVVTDKGAALRIARLVTEVLAPVVLIFVVTLIVCLHAAGLPRGLGLAFVAMAFAGGIPYGAILLGVRRGVLVDHHVSRREQRPKILAIGVVSVAAGLVVLSWMQAPRAVFALLTAMTVGGVISLAISTFWEISMHAAAAAGTVACLTVLVGPWWLIAVPVIALTGWARVVLRDHTAAQVCVGAVVGATVSTGVSLLLG